MGEVAGKEERGKSKKREADNIRYIGRDKSPQDTGKKIPTFNCDGTFIGRNP